MKFVKLVSSVTEKDIWINMDMVCEIIRTRSGGSRLTILSAGAIEQRMVKESVEEILASLHATTDTDGDSPVDEDVFTIYCKNENRQNLVDGDA